MPVNQVNNDRDNDYYRDNPAPHLRHPLSTTVDSAAIAARNEQVRLLGVELCMFRSLLPKNRPTSAAREARRQLGL